MSKALMKTGTVISILGVLLLLFSFFLTILTIAFIDDEQVLLTNEDFRSTADQTYESKLDTTGKSYSELIFDIKTRNDKDVQISIVVNEPDGNKHTINEFTPIDMKVDLVSIKEGIIVISLNIVTSGYSISDIAVKISTEEMSTISALSCCCLFWTFPSGGLFLLIGIILLLVSFGKMESPNIIKKSPIGTSSSTITSSPLNKENVSLRPAKEKLSTTTNKTESNSKSYQQSLQKREQMGERPINKPTTIKPSFFCPHCHYNASIKSESKISQGGWIVFIVLLLFFWPLCWIGLLMKDEYKVCSNCQMRLTPNDMKNYKTPEPPKEYVPNSIKLKKAQNFEKAERLEDAARLYEELEMWEKAGECRRRAKGSTVKYIHVNANDLYDKIRSGGLAVPYICPSCKGTLDLDGSRAIKNCPYCGTALDLNTLNKLVDKLLS